MRYNLLISSYLYTNEGDQLLDNIFVHTLLTFMIALLGGLLGKKSKIPAGTLLGAMVAVGIINFLKFGSILHLPQVTGVFLQIVAGCIIGLSINSDTLKELKKLFVPTVVAVSTSMFMAFAATFLIYRLTGWSLATSWLLTAPGRIQDMVILANNLDVDYTAVVVAHLVRSLVIVFMIPLLVYFGNKTIPNTSLSYKK